MRIKILFVILSIFSYSSITAQQCEDIDMSLFHMLPDTIPNKINCVDSLGLKQGWWINYTLEYNPIDKPDELAKGDYVENYSYGKYKDNIKIGDWISVANVHMIYITRKDNYYYANDTILVASEFGLGGLNKSTKFFNSDSSIIKSTSLPPDEKYPILIECNKNGVLGKECIMSYRNETIKEFSYDQFDIEFDRSFENYNRDKKVINNTLEK